MVYLNIFNFSFVSVIRDLNAVQVMKFMELESGVVQFRDIQMKVITIQVTAEILQSVQKLFQASFKPYPCLFNSVSFKSYENSRKSRNRLIYTKQYNFKIYFIVQNIRKRIYFSIRRLFGKVIFKMIWNSTLTEKCN